ncbi:MAG TPA: Uma2 family endonuclease [Azospirillaceae bacterium]|nr:Uma2 family endonuclease [Azospirillaceae bacterium]
MAVPVRRVERTLDRKMTVEEFLRWDSGDDYVWELLDGTPILKDHDPETGHAAPSAAHGRLVGTLGARIDAALARGGRPCALEIGSGTTLADGSGSYLVPDLLVTCGRSVLEADSPVLAVEVLSPSNSTWERRFKEAAYKAIPTMREVVEVAQDRLWVSVARRTADGWAVEVAEGPQARLRLESVGLDLALEELYRTVPL